MLTNANIYITILSFGQFCPKLIKSTFSKNKRDKILHKKNKIKLDFIGGVLLLRVQQ